MQAKTNVTFHNRFDIEIVDSRTGILKDTRYAENIVLDNMYNMLAARSTYRTGSTGNYSYYLSTFRSIRLGTGSGELDKTRTTLFNQVYTKVPTEIERIRAFPTSKWVQEVILSPTELVGELLTEIGIGGNDSTVSELRTHAFITDISGVPSPIDKTEYDIITVRATLYITLTCSEQFDLVDPAVNALLSRIFHGNTYNGFSTTPSLHFNRLRNGQRYSAWLGAGTSSSVTSDTVNNKWLYSYRVSADTFNAVNRIKQIGISDTLLLHIADVGYPVGLFKAGVGDGVTTQFDIHSEAYDLEVYVDDALVPPEDYTYIPFNRYMEEETIEDFLVAWTGNITEEEALAVTDNVTTNLDGWYKKATFELELDLPQPIAGIRLRRGSQTYSSNSIVVSGSNDMSTWETLGSLAMYTADRVGNTLIGDILFSEPKQYTYFRFASSGSSYDPPSLGRIRLLKDHNLIFNTPPAEGAEITAMYKVPYLPKDENYIIDITHEVQFGGGDEE